METSVLADLVFEVIPHWSGRIEKYVKEAEGSQKQSSGIIIIPSGLETPKAVVQDCDASSTRRIISTPGVAGVAMHLPLPTPVTPGGANPSDKNHALQYTQALAVAHGTSKLDAKPDVKSRFSSLTSPAVMYDGDSQNMLCDMWTALNNQRGGLRKAMMAVTRRQQFAALPPPRAMPEIAVDSEDGEGGSDKEDDDEDMEHSAEMLRLRLKMEREKMKRLNRRGPPMMVMGGESAMGGLPFKRARMIGGPPGAAPPTPPRSQQGEQALPSALDDEKMKQLLEAIDENIDKTCKVIETVAFVWLKGDSYDSHLKFILERLKDVVTKIEESGFVPPKDEPEEMATDVTVVAMAPPQTPPPTGRMSPRLEISKKRSDLTMRDAPSLRPAEGVPSMEQHVERKHSVSSGEHTVEPSMESVTPLVRHAGVIPGKVNPLEPDVLEVEDDDYDEGVVC